MTKRTYSTGEAAKLCYVSQQTIIRCFDSGRLAGFRVPGSKFRRITREGLFAFLLEHNMPLDRFGPLTAEEQAEVNRRKAAVVGPLRVPAPPAQGVGTTRLGRGAEALAEAV